MCRKLLSETADKLLEIHQRQETALDEDDKTRRNVESVVKLLQDAKADLGKVSQGVEKMEAWLIGRFYLVASLET